MPLEALMREIPLYRIFVMLALGAMTLIFNDMRGDIKESRVAIAEISEQVVRQEAYLVGLERLYTREFAYVAERLHRLEGGDGLDSPNGRIADMQQDIKRLYRYLRVPNER